MLCKFAAQLLGGERRAFVAPLAFAAVLAIVASASAFAWAQTEDLTAQEQFQQDRATLVDEARKSAHAADENIDVLEYKAKSESGPVRRQHEDLASSLSLLKGKLDRDIDQLNEVSIDYWNGLRPTVERDVSALDTQLKIAEPITHVKVP